MEAAIINTLTPKDKAIVINGGSFGQRFVRLCQIHDISYSEIALDFGKALTEEMLQEYEGKKEYSAMIVNLHETSTGVHYDIDMMKFKRNHLFLIVDAISSFLADDFNMEKLGVNVYDHGIAKSISLSSGMCTVVPSENAIQRVRQRIQSVCISISKMHLKMGKEDKLRLLRQLESFFRSTQD